MGIGSINGVLGRGGSFLFVISIGFTDSFTGNSEGKGDFIYLLRLVEFILVIKRVLVL